MTCPRCGRSGSYASDAKFCAVCGASLSSPKKAAATRGFKHLGWVLLVVAALVVWLSIRAERQGTPDEKPTPQQLAKQADLLLAAAKAQVDNKDYLRAQPSLKTIIRTMPTGSPQSVEAGTILKNIEPLATKQAKEKARRERAEQLQQKYRNGARATLEEHVLNAGYDVQVGFVMAQGASTSTNLLIVGEPVNRVFVHQLIGPGLRRSLQRDGFTKITFMKSRWKWVAEYDVASNTLTEIGK